ncbi:MAG: hypothetical protein ACD_3C00031G0002 [uncultured bacterium (gcode 4)]|uniref:Uncharacterized protein n=1 Tax=uncultured bacterium (gcode 4) TaxID=1234023 RepID=K2G0E6_9BACT|nr:MAG: hypothetical protein ACD_3C00031G0002 [uncultured bacterium (gcode 4)]
MRTSETQQVIFSHNDLFEVIAWTFPNTTNMIRTNLLYKISMVFWDKTKETVISIWNKIIEPKDREIKFEEMHHFVWEVFWEQEQWILEAESIMMNDLRQEAERIYETAKKICEITGKSFSQSINFLLENKESISGEIIDKEEKADEPASAKENLWKISLSDEDKKFIRTYVAEGKDNDDKKLRRIAMAKKFNITVRHAWIISSWSNRGNFHKEENDMGNQPDKKTIELWKKMIGEYLDEFFEWDIQSPQECSISYEDMHDCFCRDTWFKIDCAEITKVWNSLLNWQWSASTHGRPERGYSTPLVKSRHKLASGKFIIDKSCNVLLSHEVEDALKRQ